VLGYRAVDHSVADEAARYAQPWLPGANELAVWTVWRWCHSSFRQPVGSKCKINSSYKHKTVKIPIPNVPIPKSVFNFVFPKLVLSLVLT
jgi:hypothetical protein